MTVLLETNQKQIEDLQEKFNAQLHLAADLRKQLDATEKSLNHTSKLLVTAKEDLKQSQYILKEKDFIISEQKKAENALAHQACVLRADLEKSIRDNASLFSKIAREDQLNAVNRSTVNNFQANLVEKVTVLCKIVATSMDKQNKHLQFVENLCQSCLDFHDNAVLELKKKVSVSRALYVSHVEGIQNAVCLHKSTSNAGLEEILSTVAVNCSSLLHLLVVGEGEADLIIKDLQGALSIHRGEVANFIHELRERFRSCLDHRREMSSFILELLDKLGVESKKFQSHSSLVHEAQATSIADFPKAYEEQSRTEAEKLILDMTSLVSSHMHRQKELVNGRLITLRDAAIENKIFLDEHVSSVEGVTTDAKRKWEEFSMNAQHDAKDGSDFSASKHCRMELLLQQCVNTVDAACQQWKKTNISVNEMSSKHVVDIDAFIRTAVESNEQHDADVASACNVVEDDATRNCKEIQDHFESVLEHERESTKGALAALEAHSATLQQLQEDHTSQASDIDQHAEDTFQNAYMDYEPSCETPLRSEPDVPSEGTIESLRVMPMDALLEEFRENNPYESSKEKPSLIPRLPLIQLN